jgi:hypothetical protein
VRCRFVADATCEYQAYIKWRGVHSNLLNASRGAGGEAKRSRRNDSVVAEGLCRGGRVDLYWEEQSVCLGITELEADSLEEAGVILGAGDVAVQPGSGLG